MKKTKILNRLVLSGGFSLLLLLFIISQPAHSAPPSWKSFKTNSRVLSLAKEGDYLWVGTQHGLIRYDTRTEKDHTLYTSENTESGLLSNGVYTIEIAPDGSKWIGTYGGGLMHFQKNNWKTYTPFGHGSTLLYGNRWTKYQPGEGLGDLWVYDVAFDKKERMWVATWKGVSLLNGDSFQTYSEEAGLIDKWVYAIGVDLDDSLWFGTEGGVTHFDGKKWKSYTHADGLGADLKESIKDPKYSTNPRHHTDTSKLLGITNPNYVVSIVIDHEGTKWFGTWGTGLSRFDGKNWKTFTNLDGLPGNFVLALAIDKKGQVWAGTDRGVAVYNGKNWKQYTQRDGLLDNFVYSILLEEDGTKWFGTRRGLTQFVGE